ncbi:MAG: D-lactate dehydrogenase VanH-A [Clostridiales Family XIII bacterium]|jgi:D-specific alpha-keto acid dehydrogenase|nr:D-lactate dehydrogenase VanH-A [Clostridiales Family XIII bacterium]
MRMTVFGCDGEERALFCEYAKSYGVGLNLVEESVSAGNARLSGGSGCISVNHRNRLDESVLRALKDGGTEFVTTRSIGTDHIDVSAANRLGITVEAVVYTVDSVADYTVMLILMALRNAKDVLARAGNGDFSLSCARSPDLREMTVGVIGAGRIGQKVIARLRPFGCRILVCGSEKAAGEIFLPFDELIGQCDVLTFHLPLTAQTGHILNGRNMGNVKNGAYIVNTARGGLIDTAALLNALERRQLRGAALDVIEREEVVFCRNRRGEPNEDTIFLRLCALPNVIITPHTAFYTRRTLLDTVENTVLKCLKYEKDRRDIRGVEVCAAQRCGRGK